MKFSVVGHKEIKKGCVFKDLCQSLADYSFLWNYPEQSELYVLPAVMFYLHRVSVPSEIPGSQEALRHHQSYLSSAVKDIFY